MSPADQQKTVDEIAAKIGGDTAHVPPSEAAVPRKADGKISLLGVLQQQTKTGPYSPPAPVQPDVSQNPLNSPLPGPLGQLHNTIRAATQGGMEASTLNLGDELFAGVTAPFGAAWDAMHGQGFDLGKAFQRNLSAGEQNDANLRELNPGAYEFGQNVGSLGLMGKGGKTAPVAEIVPAIRGGVGRAAATGAAYGAASGLGTPGSIEDRLINAGKGAAAGAVLGTVGGKLASTAANRATTPTVNELLSGARTAFKQAEATGAVIPRDAVAGFNEALKGGLAAEGVITPSGKVAGFPKVSHALDMTNDFASADMTVKQAKTLRKAIASAAKSIDPQERMHGVQMLQQFDQFMVENGGAAAEPWALGRQMYHVGKKGETVEGLIDLAARKSRKSVAVNPESSLRNRFDNFVSKPKNLRGFTPDEIAALQRVADGTTVGNAAKAVGQLAPTTLGGLSVKGGIPFAVGSAVGGPMVGAAAAGTTLSLGLVGRTIARLSTQHQAELARQLILNGGNIPKVIPKGMSEEVRRALGNLIVISGGGRAPSIAAQAMQILTGPSQAAQANQ